MLIQNHQSQPSGFTLIEVITSIGILGVAVAIAAPSYTGWVHRQRLNSANNQIIGALNRAKQTAVRQKQPHQVSFRSVNQRVELSIHPTDFPATRWQTLPKEIQLDRETTLRRKQGNRIIQFNDYGEANGQLGRITISLVNNPKQKSCVFISTLLGKIRRGKMHARPKRGRYCY